ncbi:MAG: iron-containing alcohol dehydrogenase [Planctomycetes bacterium]|nr:iron-containing alcohol dehydrogenase [Planctomycetota bacterium]
MKPASGTAATVDFAARPRLVAGAGCLARLGELAREIGATRALLVTDQGIVAAGHAARVRQVLEGAGLVVVVYDHAHENPTTADVDACLAVAKAGNVDLIVGLGGGSAMDTAKGCNFLLTNGGQMRDYWHTHAATKPLLPLIAIPTTAGTGSECQSYALIADEATHQKMACGDSKAMARVALLDPTLTVTQPRRVTACTGLDAIGHAVETFVTTKRNPVSHLFAREAFALLNANFPVVLDRPEDLAARGAMQLGAAYAGLAIENSMLGAAHACANPLTAQFGVIHGQAVATMLPIVVRYNAADPVAAALYAELAVHAGLCAPGNVDAAVSSLTRRLDDVLKLAGLPKDLATSGVTAAAIEALADNAATQWTGTFNPRAVKAPEFRELYRLALGGVA